MCLTRREHYISLRLKRLKVPEKTVVSMGETKGKRKAVIVGEGGLNEMPFPILEILGRWSWLEVGCVPAYDCHLAICHNNGVPGTGNVQVWQAFGLQLYYRTCGLLLVLSRHHSLD